jgi:hypothetical protein
MHAAFVFDSVLFLTRVWHQIVVLCSFVFYLTSTAAVCCLFVAIVRRRRRRFALE